MNEHTAYSHFGRAVGHLFRLREELEEGSLKSAVLELRLAAGYVEGAEAELLALGDRELWQQSHSVRTQLDNTTVRLCVRVASLEREAERVAPRRAA